MTRKQLTDLTLLGLKGLASFLIAGLGIGYLIAVVFRTSASPTGPIIPMIFPIVLGSVLVGVLGILIPGVIWSSRDRKEDPYRFDRTLKAYFLLPPATFENCEKMLKDSKSSLSEIRSSKGQSVSAVWASELEQQFPSRFSSNIVETRIVTFRLLNPNDDTASQRVEAEVKPESGIRQIDSSNANVTALGVLLNTLRWSAYRIPVDTDGMPRW